MYKKKLTLIIFLLSFCVLTAEAFDRSDLVLYLPFDEGKGIETADLSDYGNNGKLNGDVKWVEGKKGKAVEFAGEISQFVEVPDDESMRFNADPFTMMAWVKTYTLKTADYQTIVSKRVPVAGDGMETASIFIKQGTSSIYIEFRDNVKAMNVFDATDANVTENKWTHVAWVKDKKELRIYIDGNLAQSLEHDRDGTVNGTQSLYVGVHIYGATRNSPFIGAIDEVAVFTTALSESEIKAAMQNLQPVEPQGKLTAMWGEIKK